MESSKHRSRKGINEHFLLRLVKYNTGYLRAVIGGDAIFVRKATANGSGLTIGAVAV
jgi:hypothetical protein